MRGRLAADKKVAEKKGYRTVKNFHGLLNNNACSLVKNLGVILNNTVSPVVKNHAMILKGKELAR
jgi:hypothetical protein